jgi:hypothetical protein
VLFAEKLSTIQKALLPASAHTALSNKKISNKELSKGKEMDKLDSIKINRSSDPSTSSLGAKDVEKRRKTQVYRLLAVYAGNQETGLTDEEASMKAEINHGWKRCADLRKLGYISDTGDRKQTSTGSLAMVCKITAEGISAI